MNHHARTIGCLLFICLFVLPEGAEAWPFRRRRTNYYQYQGPVQIAPKIDSESAEYPSLRVYYDYDRGAADEVAFEDRIRVFLHVRDEDVLNVEEPLVAEVRVIDMRDDEQTYVQYVPISYLPDFEGEGRMAALDLVNDPQAEPIVNPSTVYRVFVNLHRESEEYGADSAIGRVPTPYYVVTSGPGRLDRARREIVMRTFKEFYYTEKGWASDEGCPVDCHAYYCWATGSCTIGSNGGWANPGYIFDVYHNGGDISALAEDESIHADYVRIPGHTLMLLAYDAENQHVWTMESNFGGTIEVAIRPTNSGWTVGHLQEEHIRAGLFEVGAE